uniref:hypothetical protein n=1 Tax=Kaistia sp. MMO-174 TaxID=3081256 RepID=UPI0030187FB0
MPTFAMILMTNTQKNSAVLLDYPGVSLGPRQIDNTLANSLGEGTLVGKWVSPARLLNDPDYAVWVPFFDGYPIRVFDSET